LPLADPLLYTASDCERDAIPLDPALRPVRRVEARSPDMLTTLWLATAPAALSETLFGAYGPLAVQIMQIIWIDILLSGDNAIVIALACRGLPEHQRRLGVILGVGMAILLRVVFTVFVTALMALPWLKLVGAVLLFWIAFKLLGDGAHDEEEDVKSSTTLMGAIWTVAVADFVMSLDNVLAIAAAAKGNMWLVIFGLVVSIPLIMAGATIFLNLLSRFPILVWAGAALLGWIAGDLLVADLAIKDQVTAIAASLGITLKQLGYICAALGALLVIVIGKLTRPRRAAAS
jgi:YjbE family integral membrane protein